MSGFYETDGEYRASLLFLRCPFCGSKGWLYIRKVSWFSVRNELETRYGLKCQNCKLAFGEEDGSPIYKSEGDLLADWNVRKY